MIFTEEKYLYHIRLSLLLSFIIVSITGLIIFLPISYRYENKSLYWIISSIILLSIFYILFKIMTRKYRLRKKIAGKPFPHEWELILNSDIAYFTTLDNEEREKFKHKVKIFLGEKQITGIKTDIDDKTRLLIAASAIIPIFNYPNWEYDNLGEILVYPSNFNEDYGFEGDSNILGLVVSNGKTMIVSKPALYAGFAAGTDGSNVGIHEFAHKLDEADGMIDGIPALMMNKKTIPKWLSIIEKESELIRSGKSDINSYALTNNAEFFAVTSEYFFENPTAMSKKHPDLYNLLKKIFQQDTKSMFSSAINSIIRPHGKKIGRNSLCPCGSGKKYKKCCLKR